MGWGSEWPFYPPMPVDIRGSITSTVTGMLGMRDGGLRTGIMAEHVDSTACFLEYKSQLFHLYGVK